MKKLTHISFYVDNYDYFEIIDDAKLGRLFRSLFQYAKDGIETDFSEPELRMLYTFLIKNIKREEEKYEERCETNRRNRSKKRIVTNRDESSLRKEKKRKKKIKKKRKKKILGRQPRLTLALSVKIF